MCKLLAYKGQFTRFISIYMFVQFGPLRHDDLDLVKDH